MSSGAGPWTLKEEMGVVHISGEGSIAQQIPDRTRSAPAAPKRRIDPAAAKKRGGNR